MIFSSTVFILIFMPITFFGYFWLNKKRLIIGGKVWLTLASFLFYGYWNINYIPLLMASILFNFIVGGATSPYQTHINLNNQKRKWVLGVGIVGNLLLLGYFKYANFFINNLNALSGSEFHLHHIILPLGISFYTFTQIAFLVDSYQGKAKEYDLINYALFVTFFPHLIAGPILHHTEMMSQFKSRWTLCVRYRNILMGLFIFSIGLFKKVMIADIFAIWADAGFSPGASHHFFSAWATSLSYTFQLYFDFSGYCDMAIGAALMFNIWLPLNFNSPYKAYDIQDFWRRWHITLGRYLRDYLYIPLGGNRSGMPRMYANLFITFLLGGLWHGASWMFVMWGALHGSALIIHRLWKKAGYTLPKTVAWLITFLFVNITWVFFRANSMDDAWRILKGMVDVASIQGVGVYDVPYQHYAWGGALIDTFNRYLPAGMTAYLLSFAMIAIAFVICSQRNAFQMTTLGRIGWGKVAYMTLLFSIAMYATNTSSSAVFLYYNF
ncbi:MAG TPA: MBOAT family protein [Alcaligenaceae bacterium]|nr:MBOAT family protein [Alcaligenaceae bacterium]